MQHNIPNTSTDQAGGGCPHPGPAQQVHGQDGYVLSLLYAFRTPSHTDEEMKDVTAAPAQAAAPTPTPVDLTGSGVSVNSLAKRGSVKARAGGPAFSPLTHCLPALRTHHTRISVRHATDAFLPSVFQSSRLLPLLSPHCNAATFLFFIPLNSTVKCYRPQGRASSPFCCDGGR